MHVEVLTLTGAKFQGEAAELALRTATGEIGILPHHEPMVAVVVPGPVIVRPVNGHEHVFAGFGGVVEVTPDAVRLLVDEVEPAEALVQSEIEAALARAEALKAAAKTKHELANAQSLVDRHTVRLEVSHLRRRHRERSQNQPQL